MNDTLIKFDGKNCAATSCGYTGAHAEGVVAHINKIFAQEIHELSTNISGALHHAFGGDFGAQAVAAVAGLKDVSNHRG